MATVALPSLEQLSALADQEREQFLPSPQTLAQQRSYAMQVPVGLLRGAVNAAQLIPEAASAIPGVRPYAEQATQALEQFKPLSSGGYLEQGIEMGTTGAAIAGSGMLLGVPAAAATVGTGVLFGASSYAHKRNELEQFNQKLRERGVEPMSDTQVQALALTHGAIMGAGQAVIGRFLRGVGGAAEGEAVKEFLLTNVLPKGVNDALAKVPLKLGPAITNAAAMDVPFFTGAEATSAGMTRGQLSDQQLQALKQAGIEPPTAAQAGVGMLGPAAIAAVPGGIMRRITKPMPAAGQATGDASKATADQKTTQAATPPPVRTEAEHTTDVYNDLATPRTPAEHTADVYDDLVGLTRPAGTPAGVPGTAGQPGAASGTASAETPPGAAPPNVLPQGQRLGPNLPNTIDVSPGTTASTATALDPTYQGVPGREGVMLGTDATHEAQTQAIYAQGRQRSAQDQVANQAAADQYAAQARSGVVSPKWRSTSLDADMQRLVDLANSQTLSPEEQAHMDAILAQNGAVRETATGQVPGVTSTALAPYDAFGGMLRDAGMTPSDVMVGPVPTDATIPAGPADALSAGALRSALQEAVAFGTQPAPGGMAGRPERPPAGGAGLPYESLGTPLPPFQPPAGREATTPVPPAGPGPEPPVPPQAPPEEPPPAVAPPVEPTPPSPPAPPTAPDVPTPPPATPTGVVDLRPQDISVDADRFQFKIIKNQRGVTGSLTGSQAYNPRFAGVLDVWRDPTDGKTYVVNGHNRLDLARRSGTETVRAEYIDVATPEEARAIGALSNLADGHGTAVDAAKFLRDTGRTPEDLAAQGITLSGRIARDAVALATLNPALFGMVVRGEFSEERAVAIGERLTDPVQQKAVVDLIDQAERRGRRVNPDLVRELADMVQSAPTQTTQEQTLFGTDERSQSLAVEKAGLLAYVKQELSKRARVFSTVGQEKNASELTAAGNVIDVAGSQQEAQQATQLLAIFDRVKNLSGEVSDLINEAARRLGEGAHATRVRQQLLARLREALPRALGRGPEPPGGGVPSPASATGDVSGESGGSDLFGRNTTPVPGRVPGAQPRNQAQDAEGASAVSGATGAEHELGERRTALYAFSDVGNVVTVTFPDQPPERVRAALQRLGLRATGINPDGGVTWDAIKKGDLAARTDATLRRLLDESPGSAGATPDDQLGGQPPGHLQVLPGGQVAASPLAPTFFSRVKHFVQDKIQESVAVDRLKSLLNPQKSGIKAEELKWLGLDQWLDERGGRVTKQALLDFLDQNQVQVQVKVLGDTGEDRVRNTAHTEPGGIPGSDREILLHLPPGSPGAPAEPFTTDSTHYGDTPNVVAWLRVNDRVDSQGRKVLFVEEVQSKWRMEGTKQEFTHETAASLRARRAAIDAELRELPGQHLLMEGRRRRHEMTAADYRAWQAETRGREEALRRELQSFGTALGGTPRAPFVTQGDWYQLPWKWALRYASEHGYDGVAWTTGEMQQERYHLRKQIGEVHYDPVGRILKAYDPQGGEVLSKGIPPEHIHQYIGEGNAHKLLTQPREYVEGRSSPVHRLTNQDFAIGGDWATNLYDKDFPGFLNKYGKQWGARVEETGIDTTPHDPLRGGFEIVNTTTGQVADRAATRAEAEATLAAFGNQSHYTIEEIVQARREDTVPYLPITDAMRTSVLTQGQPQFQRTGEVPAGLGPVTLAEVKREYESPRAQRLGVHVEQLDNGDFRLHMPRQGAVVDIQNVHHVSATEAEVRLGYGEVGEGAQVAGRTDTLAPGMLRVQIGEGRTETTLLHEGKGHVFEEIGLLDAKDIAQLNKDITKQGGVPGYPDGPEARAEFLARKINEARGALPEGPLGRIVQKVQAFFDTIVRAMGLRTTGQIVRRIESGRIFEGEGHLGGDAMGRLQVVPPGTGEGRPEEQRDEPGIFTGMTRTKTLRQMQEAFPEHVVTDLGGGKFKIADPTGSATPRTIDTSEAPDASPRQFRTFEPKVYAKSLLDFNSVANLLTPEQAARLADSVQRVERVSMPYLTQDSLDLNTHWNDHPADLQALLESTHNASNPKRAAALSETQFRGLRDRAMGLWEEAWQAKERGILTEDEFTEFLGKWDAHNQQMEYSRMGVSGAARVMRASQEKTPAELLMAATKRFHELGDKLLPQQREALLARIREAMAIDDPLAKARDLRKISRDLQGNPTLRNYYLDFFYGSNLSNPISLNRKTWSVWSNVVFHNAVLRPVGGALDYVVSAMTGKERTMYVSEMLPALAKTFTGIPQAATDFWWVWTGDKRAASIPGIHFKRGFEEADVGSVNNSWARSPYPIMRAMAPYITGASRAFEAMGVALRHLSTDAELAGLARRAAMKELGKPDAAFEAQWLRDIARHPDEYAQAIQTSKELTMQDTPGVLYNWLMQGRQVPQPFGFLFQMLMPFAGTPDALLRHGMELFPGWKAVPWAYQHTAVDWKGWLPHITWNAQEAFSKPGVMVMLAKQLVGTAMVGMALGMWQQGTLTGPAPVDATKRDQFYREGKLPYAIKLGNRWLSWNDFHPLNMPMGIATAVFEGLDQMWERHAHQPDVPANVSYDMMAGLAVASQAFIGHVIEGSYFSGLAQFIAGTQAHASAGDIPRGVMRQVVRMTMPYVGLQQGLIQGVDSTGMVPGTTAGQTMVRNPSSLSEMMADATLFGAYTSAASPPRLDALGRPMHREFTPLDLAPLAPPIRRNLVTETPLEQAFKATNYSPGGMQRAHPVTHRRLEQDVYDRLMVRRGELMQGRLDALAGSANFRRIPPSAQKKLLQQIVSDAGRQASLDILGPRGVAAAVP